VSFNSLDQFPVQVCKLRSLKKLYFAHNALDELPECLGEMRCLEKADFSGNKIRSIPRAILDCCELRQLGLDANLLQDIPSWLGDHPCLSFLSVQTNPMSKDASSYNFPRMRVYDARFQNPFCCTVA